ncbi:MAG: response regulator transcription factor [Planctomycetota bacterium]|jgi:FixJ family two-component response regulator
MKEAAPTAFIVDDDEAVLKGLAVLLRSVGIQAECYLSAQDFLNAYNPSKPGCLLLDVRMPGMSGLELQKVMLDKKIHLPIIMISGHSDVPIAVQALKMGAMDFIEKPFSDQNLLDAIQKAFKKDAEDREKFKDLVAIKGRLNQLTKREREVIRQVVQGKPNKQIASVLGLSKKTVEFHRANIMKKMEAQSVAELVKYVMQAEEG